MIKLAFVVAVCLVGSMAASMAQALDKPYYDLENTEDHFQEFIQKYGKAYNRREYYERLEIFKENLESINRRNAESPETVFAVNHFTDLKPEEFQKYTGFMPSKEKGVKAVRDRSIVLPPSYDWRDHHAVSHLKPNQGYCSSCYIFSAIGNIEGQHAIKHQQCLALSESQALDCLRCTSCGGGIMHHVMQEFANRTVGVMLEEDYPYRDDVYRCREDAKKAVVKVKDGQQIDIPDEETLMQKLVELGPLAVGITVDDTFRYYQSGIIYPTDECNTVEPNHGVLLVGYGEDKNGTKYWAIKNSWGENWGEKGYMRLLRGVDACQMGTGYTASATVY